MHLEFNTIAHNIRNPGRCFIETTATIPGTGLVVGKAIHNHAKERTTNFSRIAFLNDLTSIKGVLAGRVNTALIGPYRDTLEELDSTITLPDNIGEKIVGKLISELPPDISQLCIVVSEKSRRPLEKYYLNIGDTFIQEGLIKESGYYTDGITFHL